jgi:CRISPR-associated protein Csb2
MPLLTVSVRLHDPRYHGAGDWPPAPARLFQALVAAAAQGARVPEAERRALAWLEALEPPDIVAPPARDGQRLGLFVPGNDLDALGGDPGRIGEGRGEKRVAPKLLPPGASIRYCWRFPADEHQAGYAAAVVGIAHRLYQLGRGVDMAWAVAQVEEESAEQPTDAGSTYRPARGGGVGRRLQCPSRGTLGSLEERFRQSAHRFAPGLFAGKGALVLAQPRRPLLRTVTYESPAARLLFELRVSEAVGAPFAAYSLTMAKHLAEAVRDKSARRLRPALPATVAAIDHALVGRAAGEAAKRERVRIIPLPSIGHEHADHQIRRILVEVPPDCPIPVGDLRWAFTGLEVPGEPAGGPAALLVPADDDKFLRHYGAGEGGAPARLWRTVTPAALPWSHGRSRSGPERLARDGRLGQAVRQALRHAGIAAPVDHVRAQREPYDRNGDRAENFAAPPRFPAGRLWHVEVAFATPLAGPLVIGDGRYLGLGVMAPCSEAWRAVLEFAIEAPSGPGPADVPAVTSAVRRALMARARELGNGSREIPRLFSGHESDGGAARSGRHEHIFIAACPAAAAGRLDRLLIAAPWACDKTVAPQGGDAAAFDRVASGLRAVTMGHAGVLSLAPPEEPRDGSRAVGPATVWASATPYRPTRHPSRGQDAAGAIISDIAAECRRRGLPVPRVELGAVRAGPKGGRPEAEARLAFSVAVRGPILLGRDSHLGGGLFLAEPIR